MFRIGFGYDAHRFCEGRPLILGGVAIPNAYGLEGHSDADVVTHAIIDAIIGALGLGDIGCHFPDTDPAFKGVSSLSLLEKTMKWIERDGFEFNNMDSTIVAQKPKLAIFFPKMKESLAGVFNTSISRLNIKAKTTEGMGFCGRLEGIEAFAIVSLMSKAK